MTRISWFRTNGFLLGLAAAAGLAFFFPGPGSRDGALHPELLGNIGIAVILFLQGLSLPLEKIRSGAGNWRLHLIIQLFTFVIFPLVGLAFHQVIPRIWTSEPAAIRDGFLFLCVLPSTISMSVVLTAAARGNTAGALFNAALSNIIGVVLTPLLVHLLMRSTGQTGEFGPLLVKITLLTLLPFGLGMLLHPLCRDRVEAGKAWITRLSNGIILFIVYTAFCDAVTGDIWGRTGWKVSAQVMGVVILLFAVMSGLVHLACRWSGLAWEDEIAAYFCSVKKTLAMGVPLAVLIFGAGGELSLILLPIMFYHPLQLLVNGMLANRWSRRAGQGPG